MRAGLKPGENKADDSIKEKEKKGRNREEMIGCDSLGYLSLEGMYESFEGRRNFCVGCFSGVYPVAAPMEALEDNLERVEN